jgi:hypothetical protein
MTVRITHADQQGQRVLRIDGWLESPDLPELGRAIGESADALALDLSGRRDADETALALLRRLRASGAQLVGSSAYMDLRLGPPRAPDDGRPP